MTFQLQSNGDGLPVLNVHGNLDGDSSVHLLERLKACSEGRVGLDLSGVESINFAGAAFLLRLDGKLSHGREVVIVKGSKRIQRFMSVMRPVLVRLLAA